MRRRDFITLFGSSAVGWPLAARAQQSDRMRRIGWLEQAQPDDQAGQARIMAVTKDLEQLGWVVGRNLQIDYRWGVVSPEMAQRLGGELLNLSPDLIMSVGTPGVKALQQATTSVPIVFMFVTEPVDQGFVQSLAHPGGNITGLHIWNGRSERNGWRCSRRSRPGSSTSPLSLAQRRRRMPISITSLHRRRAKRWGFGSKSVQ